MRTLRHLPIFCIVFAASTLLAAPAATQSAGASESADAAYKKIASLRGPAFDTNKREDPKYVEKYMAERDAFMQERVAFAKDFVAKFPDDSKAPDMLGFIASQTKDKDEQLKIHRQIVSTYPDSETAKTSRGAIRKIEDIGKPFELKFTDAISGKSISMADLKGKVVVVDFWATWCGPCVGEMPNMKELYAKYKDKGVEFIGVSLDQPEDKGGLKALKAFIEENKIDWPQYYQGKGWESDFSRGWGINSIPTMFVIDKEGNLNSTQARGQLEQLIPQLLGEKKGQAQRKIIPLSKETHAKQ